MMKVIFALAVLDIRHIEVEFALQPDRGKTALDFALDGQGKGGVDKRNQQQARCRSNQKAELQRAGGPVHLADSKR